MTLKEFAKQAGVVTSRCDKAWGGTWAYSIKGECSTFCGYRTEREAYAAWVEDTFGEQAASALLNLLKTKR